VLVGKPARGPPRCTSAFARRASRNRSAPSGGRSAAPRTAPSKCRPGSDDQVHRRVLGVGAAYVGPRRSSGTFQRYLSSGNSLRFTWTSCERPDAEPCARGPDDGPAIRLDEAMLGGACKQCKRCHCFEPGPHSTPSPGAARGIEIPTGSRWAAEEGRRKSPSLWISGCRYR
jgi:hypothetical protein